MKKLFFFLAILISAFSIKAQVPISNTVTVDGVKSADADGTIASYSWKQVSGTSTTITNGNTASATIAFTVAGSFVYSLTVTDNDGGVSAPVNITITVDASNKIPVAVISIGGVVVSSYRIKLPSN